MEESVTDPIDLNTERQKRKQRQAPPREGWEGLLQCTPEGNVKRTLANTLTILSEHEEWHGLLAYDAFAESVVTVRPPPTRDQDRPAVHEAGEWSEADSVRTAAWLADKYHIDVGPMVVEQAALSVARRRVVHPVRDYLAGLRWDASQRLPGMLAAYFGAPSNPYTESIGVKWMIGSVARVMRPACQMDTMLVLEGPQGIRKSTALRVLAGEWFADSGLAIGEKDSYQNLRRVWIYEIPEFASIKAARDIERVKAFLTSRCDRYRPSYARRAIDVPRQCVFAGSTNESEYLLDRTGSRRFWPARCGRIDIDGLRRDRDQLWAEAVSRYESREPHWIESAEVQQLAAEEQAERTPVDPWLEIFAAWLEKPNQQIRLGMDDYVRLDIEHDGLTTDEALRGAIGMSSDRLDRMSEMRAGACLRELGYVRYRVRRGDRRVYAYFRPESQLSLLSPPGTE